MKFNLDVLDESNTAASLLLHGALTSSRAAGCGLVRLAAADREDAGAAAEAEAVGFAAASLFLFSCGLSRESSTVASKRKKRKQNLFIVFVECVVTVRAVLLQCV